ncbi:MAG: hypothetical protein IKD43_02285, partial [Clostridia bacterium]|nr:hypothetical protein [Clostridia bacterium]
EVMMGSLFTLAVNGTAVDVSAVKLQTTEGTDNSPSNYYTFCGYVNLNAGANSIVLTRTDATVSGGAFNFWGMRITAQSATITPAAAPAAPAQVAMLPGKDD